MYDLVLQNGFVVDPINNVEGFYDIAIENSKIAKVVPKDTDLKAKEYFDLEGLFVCPGLIDMHTHVTGPGFFGEIGYKMIAESGVTTAIDFFGPIDEILDKIPMYGSGINVGGLNAILPGSNIISENPSKKDISSFIDRSLSRGCLGIKIMGGHTPLDPEIIRRTIEICNDRKVFVASHAGSTKTGSNLMGVKEAISLAQGEKLFLAHVNAYCRGMINDPLVELNETIKLLKQNPNIYSGSHLALFNFTEGGCVQGIPSDHVTRNCLKMRDYPITQEGLKKAILDGYASVLQMGESIKLISGTEGVEYWNSNLNSVISVSFPVNLPNTAFVLACARNKDRSFVIDLISTDGGNMPRNIALEKGLCLVKFGAISIRELIYKMSPKPAQLLGLSNKGSLSVGGDADITIFNYEKQKAVHSLVEGKFILKSQKVIGKKGKIITSSYGKEYLEQKQIPHIVCKNKPLFMN